MTIEQFLQLLTSSLLLTDKMPLLSNRSTVYHLTSFTICAECHIGTRQC